MPMHTVRATLGYSTVSAEIYKIGNTHTVCRDKSDFSFLFRKAALLIASYKGFKASKEAVFVVALEKELFPS